MKGTKHPVRLTLFNNNYFNYNYELVKRELMRKLILIS